MRKQKILIRLTCYFVFISSLLFILHKSGIHVSDLSPELILSLAHDNLFIVLIIMLALMMLQNLFTFIPLILVITINISLFGFWYGYFYSTFSSVVGSTLIFLSIRYIFPTNFDSPKLVKHKEKVERNGFLFVFLGRILPFLPTNLINIVSGLSAMNVKHFIYATTLGNMIYGFILASASLSVITLIKHHPILVLLVITIGISIFLFVRNGRNNLRSTDLAK